MGRSLVCSVVKIAGSEEWRLVLAALLSFAGLRRTVMKGLVRLKQI